MRQKTEYFSHWGIENAVFTRPYQGPESLFFDREVERGIQRFLSQLATNQPTLSITGPVGSGKTSVCLYIYQTLPISEFEVLYLKGPRTKVERAEQGWLLSRLTHFFGETPEEAGLIAGFEELRLEGRKLVLFIDGIELLTRRIVDEIFTVLERSRQNLSIVLIGRSDFKAVSKTKKINELDAPSIVLENWTLEKFIEFVEFALLRSDLALDLFSREQLEPIHKACGGLPYYLARAAENCLIESYIAKAPKISLEIVQEALKFSPRPPPPIEVEIPREKDQIDNSGYPAQDLPNRAPTKPKKRRGRRQRGQELGNQVGIELELDVDDSSENFTIDLAEDSPKVDRVKKSSNIKLSNLFYKQKGSTSG